VSLCPEPVYGSVLVPSFSFPPAVHNYFICRCEGKRKGNKVLVGGRYRILVCRLMTQFISLFNRLLKEKRIKLRNLCTTVKIKDTNYISSMRTRNPTFIFYFLSWKRSVAALKKPTAASSLFLSSLTPRREKEWTILQPSQAVSTDRKGAWEGTVLPATAAV